jgi:hypothetical protein
MNLTKPPELLIRNDESLRVPQRRVRVVLTRDNQDLETFLAERSQLANGLVYVLVDVVAVNDSVNLEFDAMCATQLAQRLEVVEVFADSATNLDVRGFVEGIAGYRHDV